MGEFIEFQINEHIAAQKTIIEDKVHEEVVFVEGKAPLPRLEKEPLPSSSRKRSS